MAFAREEGRVVVTYDIDFLRLHRKGASHSGIIYCPPWNHSIGRVVRCLVRVHGEHTVEADG